MICISCAPRLHGLAVADVRRIRLRCAATDRKPLAAPMPAIAYKALTNLHMGTPCAHSMNGDKPVRTKECLPGQKAGERAGPGLRHPPPRYKAYGLAGERLGRQATSPPQASRDMVFITMGCAENVARTANQRRMRDFVSPPLHARPLPWNDRVSPCNAMELGLQPWHPGSRPLPTFTAVPEWPCTVNVFIQRQGEGDHQ